MSEPFLATLMNLILFPQTYSCYNGIPQDTQTWGDKNGIRQEETAFNPVD
jgi:hypothetical protein